MTIDDHRHQLREINEHALRLLAVKRDYPSIDHRGTEPEILRNVIDSDYMKRIERDFYRTA